MHHQPHPPYTLLFTAPRLLLCCLYQPLVVGNRELSAEEPLGLYGIFNELMG